MGPQHKQKTFEAEVGRDRLSEIGKIAYKSPFHAKSCSRTLVIQNVCARIPFSHGEAATVRLAAVVEWVVVFSRMLYDLRTYPQQGRSFGNRMKIVRNQRERQALRQPAVYDAA